MSIYVVGLLWVLGVGLVAGTLAYLVRRIGETQGVVDNNEAAGQVFTLVGGLQAVLLAFVLISLFDGVTAAEDGSYEEADSLVAAVWAAQELPDGAGVATQARAYAEEVIEREWPRMSEGTAVDGAGWTALERLRAAVATAPAIDEWAVDRKNEANDQLWTVYQQRQERLNTATSGGVNSVVWFALLVGAAMAVALPILFGGPKPATHILIVSILAGTMALLLFATQQLQNPYGGGAQVSPAAFESALDRLR
ncbi:bestrophin-like domain [Actinophytocola sp. KF-1]